MKKENIQKVLQDPTTLRALIAQVDNGAPEGLTLANTCAWALKWTNGTIIVDIYDPCEGTVYVVAYLVGDVKHPHSVLYDIADISTRRGYPVPDEYTLRVITVAPDGVEVTGFGPLTIGGEPAPWNAKASLRQRYDSSNPGIAELLAIIDGKDIVPDTVLGRCAKEALKK